MKKQIVSAAMVVGFLLTGLQAGAGVLTFDDISTTTVPHYFPISNGYGGFDWSNMWVADPVAAGYGGTGYEKGIVSGTQIAFNGYGDIAVTFSGADFDFNGAYFTSGWYEDNVLTVQGYNDGFLKYTAQMVLNTAGPQWLAANFAGVDQLNFGTSNYQFAMDNFTYNQNPVPIPGAALLLGSGLTGLLGWSRRKKK